MKTLLTKQLLIIMVAVTMLSTSCKKSSDDSGGTSTTVAELIITDVAYASTSPLQKMDVYLPANRSTTNTYAIIMIHGGSWSGGDKTDFGGDIPTIRSLLGNYAVFNLNYRLANGTSVLITQQQDDINAAIDFITSKAADYKINTSKLGIMGASAGAHLALLKAYKANTDGKIKAVVDLFGPNDMAWMYNNHPVPSITQPTIANAVGGTPTTNPAAYTSGSPINFVTSTVPPTIIFHGTADIVVPISESDRLKARLQLNGVTNNYITYTGEGHGWTGANLVDTYNKATDWIKLYVK
jgi:dipeptidyl aminopeptidase/acylaminoacyl peptidase